jgi:hypothetical protein
MRMLLSLLCTAAYSSVSVDGQSSQAVAWQATRRRSPASRGVFAAAIPCLPSISRCVPGAPSLIDPILALAYPILEAGASVRAAIAAFSGSNDIPNELVLLPVPFLGP